eukprot:6881005-Prymnesium_polylepis.1
MARDKKGFWCAAKVLAVRDDGFGIGHLELRVHFQGWKSKFDEWIPVGSGMFRPLEPDAGKASADKDKTTDCKQPSSAKKPRTVAPAAAAPAPPAPAPAP